MGSTLLHVLRQAAMLRRKWASAEAPSFLGWISVLDPAVAEVEVEWGYDGLIIDTEHSTFDATSLRGVLMAFRGTDCVPIVRVGANDPYQIKIALDLGAGGVLVPLIQDAEDARAAVAACRYPPQGTRGVSPRRASNYFREAKEYLAEANGSILLMIQIECAEAYRNLDSILGVEDVDCLFIGQADLSASMGHMWDPGHPQVIQTVEDIIRRCRAANRAVAVASASDAKQIKHWLDTSANVIGAGGDLGFMQAGFRAFRDSLIQQGVPFDRRV